MNPDSRNPKRTERIREIFEMMPQYEPTRHFKKFSLLKPCRLRESNSTTLLPTREKPEEEQCSYGNTGRRRFECFVREGDYSIASLV